MTLPLPVVLRRIAVLAVSLLCVMLAIQAVAAPTGRSAGRPQGKPVPPIAMRYEVAGAVSLGQPITVTVSITPEQPLDNVVVSLAADEGLVLVAPPAGLEFGNVAAGREIHVVIGLTPLALAVLRLNVSVAGAMHGEVQSRNLSIPIRLGAAATSPAELKLGADGQILHSLPTQGAPQGARR